MQALREYSRLAYLQYNGGYAPYTDVLQAEQQLFPAELNLACCARRPARLGRAHLPGHRRRLGRHRPEGRRRAAEGGRRVAK